MSNYVKNYLDDESLKVFCNIIINDKRLKSIGDEYRRKIKRRGRKYNRHNNYLLQNKILAAIKKRHYSLNVEDVQKCNVIIKKRSKEGIKIINKEIKLKKYDRYDLIVFIAIITSQDPYLEEFFKISDVKYILRQLNIFGISNLVNLCK